MRVILVAGPSSGPTELPMGVLTLAAISKRQYVPVDIAAFPSDARQEEALVRAAAAADLVGFSTVCSTYPQVLLLCERIKRCSPSTFVILGGPQATSTAQATMQRFRSIDLIIRGEAEAGWTALMEHLRRGRREGESYAQDIPGAIWRSGDDLVEHPLPPLASDLDTLPIPAFESYAPLMHMPVAMVEVGRGCPYGCTFCSTNTFFKRRFRMKTPPRILEEVDRLHALFGTTHFDFIHDMFTVRRDTVESICRAMAKRRYTWSCSCRTDRLDEDLLQKMFAAGCTGMYVGLETGSERLQKDLKKGLHLRDAVATLRLARRMGFAVTASLIVGFPQETHADLRDTLLLATELMSGMGTSGPKQITCQVHLFAPLADTPLADEGWRFGFDGHAANTVELGRDLSAAERTLIESDFSLFSAFYHPVDTVYDRADYLVLTRFLETRNPQSLLWRYVLEHARSAFVEFLVGGNFAANLGTHAETEDPARLAAEMFCAFAQKTHHGRQIRGLLTFEDALREVAEAPIGCTAVCQLPAGSVHLLDPGSTLSTDLRNDDLVSVALCRSPRGVEIAPRGRQPRAALAC